MMNKIVTSVGLLLLTFAQPAFSQSFDGYALYNEGEEFITYLIDKDGNIAHSWSLADECNYTVLLRDNGNIVRGAKHGSNVLSGAAVGGKVQEIDPSGTVVWEYVYSNADHCSHHDITLLPNGNVILTAWEVKTSAECTQAGVDDPATEQWPTHFIELQQNGASADIVWEWHIWDHMVQDHDPTKDNYGVIANNPQLMDINLLTVWDIPFWDEYDWFHVNGIDYNSTLDQLVFSSRFTSEIYVIDHSTTTAEAASHAGGNSGMGGDILYRWGNPSNYGVTGTQTIAAAVHDPRWIEDDGRPNGGFIQFLNNEGGSGGGSVVDAIEAPEAGFNYTMAGSTYAPSSYDWRHVCLVSATGQSSHNRMSNGNTFVNISGQYMYEVDASDNLVWQYAEGPYKAFRYECSDPGIVALLGADPCGLLSINEETLKNIAFYPNPSTGIFNIDGVDMSETQLDIIVRDISGNIVLEITNASSIDLTSFTEGVYFATLVFDGQKATTKKISLIR
ncbi:MAG: hypothetical protein ACI837_000071 [Crocinitomicaceae bacterium]|jgi:hypothetical protein